MLGGAYDVIAYNSMSNIEKTEAAQMKQAGLFVVNMEHVLQAEWPLNDQ